jgi:hypothetical protein|tara:strand:+ start:708 stop:1646 length:939 start_codon:yes stop_codon:yes gene_type:complete
MVSVKYKYNDLIKRIRFVVMGLMILMVASCESQNLPDVSDISMVIATTSDVTVGINRIGFSLIDFDGHAIAAEKVKVEAIFFPAGSNRGENRYEALAEWKLIPGTVTRGLYVAYVEFDEPGEATTSNPGFWQLVSTFEVEEKELWSKAAISVFKNSSGVQLNTLVPSSVTPTGRDVDSLFEISSSLEPDPDLYELSIHEAIANGKPSVFVFATPALCVSKLCGPIVRMISEIKNDYDGNINFVHVEVFENPDVLVQEGRLSGNQVAAVEEWGLVTEPWVFVVDRDGILINKYEIFVSSDEIRGAIGRLIDSN